MAVLSKRVEENIGVEKVIGFIKKYWINLGGDQLKLEEFNGHGRVSYVINIPKAMNFLQLNCGLVVETQELIEAYETIFQKLKETNPCIDDLTINVSNDQTVINVFFKIIFVQPHYCDLHKGGTK